MEINPYGMIEKNENKISGGDTGNRTGNPREEQTEKENQSWRSSHL